MLCPVCKADIKEDAKFCIKCGNKIPRCPTCGMVITRKMVYCINDGTRLPENIIAMFADDINGETHLPIEEPLFMERKKCFFPAIGMMVLALFVIIAVAGGIFFLGGDSEKAQSYSLKTAEADKSVAALTEEESVTVENADEGRTDVEIEEAESVSGKITETGSAVMDTEPVGTEAEPEAANISMSNIIKTEASSCLSEYGMTHTADRVIDVNLSTAWVEGASDQGIGEGIRFTFDGSYRINGLLINAGYQKNDSLFKKNSRPKEILIEFNDGHDETHILKDINSQQQIDFDEYHIADEMTIYILSVYEGDTYQDTCISEIFLY